VDQIGPALEPSTSRSRRTESKCHYHYPRPAAAAGPPSLPPIHQRDASNGHSPPGPTPTLNDARHLPVSLRPGPAGDIGLPGCLARNEWATWTRALRWGRSCAYVPRDDASWPRSNRAAGLRCRILSAVWQVPARRQAHLVLTLAVRLRIGDAGSLDGERRVQIGRGKISQMVRGRWRKGYSRWWGVNGRFRDCTPSARAIGRLLSWTPFELFVIALLYALEGGFGVHNQNWSTF
jgi:hypothetical protein